MEILIGVMIGSIITFVIFRVERKDRLRISERERKDKFKLAAIERRLEASQQAFAHCGRFLEAIDFDNEAEIKIIFKEGREFYNNNSLYLEQGTRKKFVEALGFINAYCPKFTYLKDFAPEERKKALDTFHNESQKVFELAKVIQEEVQLEPLGIGMLKQ